MYEWLVAPCVGNTIADQDDVDAIRTQVVRSTDAPIVAALDSKRQASLLGTRAIVAQLSPGGARAPGGHMVFGGRMVFGERMVFGGRGLVVFG